MPYCELSYVVGNLIGLDCISNLISFDCINSLIDHEVSQNVCYPVCYSLAT